MALCRDGVYQPSSQAPSVAATYVLYTRFNLALKFKITTFTGRTNLAAGGNYDFWLKNRIHLFEKYCLPSVLNQTKRPDLWLIGFSDIGKQVIEPLLETIGRHPWIVPIWQRHDGGRYEHDGKMFRRECGNRIDARSTHVITSRIDSDDGISRLFFEDLERYAAAVLARNNVLEDFWVSFPVGMQYAAGACRLYNSPNNHFLSRVQTVQSFRVPKRHKGGHVNVYDHGNVYLALTDEPMWVEHVHGGNVTNHLRHQLPRLASTARLLARCGITVSWKERLRWWRPSLIPAHLWTFRKTIKRRLRAAGLMKPRKRV